MMCDMMRDTGLLCSLHAKAVGHDSCIDTHAVYSERLRLDRKPVGVSTQIQLIKLMNRLRHRVKPKCVPPRMIAAEPKVDSTGDTGQRDQLPHRKLQQRSRRRP